MQNRWQRRARQKRESSMVGGVDSRVRLLGFKSQPPESPLTPLSVCDSTCNDRDGKTQFFVGLSWE